MAISSSLHKPNQKVFVNNTDIEYNYDLSYVAVMRLNIVDGTEIYKLIEYIENYQVPSTTNESVKGESDYVNL